jgi:hypothetical protein
VVAEQLVVERAADLAVVGAVEDLPEDAGDRRPAPVADLVAAAGRPAAVARPALLARAARLATVGLGERCAGRRGTGEADEEGDEEREQAAGSSPPGHRPQAATT